MLVILIQHKVSKISFAMCSIGDVIIDVGIEILLSSNICQYVDAKWYV